MIRPFEVSNFFGGKSKEPSNLIQSGFLLRLTTGKNLALKPLTTFKKFKFEQFVFPLRKKENYKTISMH